MTEKERELRQKMAEKQTRIQDLLKENRLDDAEAVTDELRGLKREAADEADFEYRFSMFRCGK